MKNTKMKPAARLGQYFLQNQDVIAKIISAIAPQKNGIILEIGPGHGELTEKLKNENKKFELQKDKLKIILIEKEEIFCELLKKRFKDDKQIEIVRGDALALVPLLVSQLEKERIQKYKITGNIPYYITGHLFRLIGELESKPERAIFMIQKEVALRIVAQPPKMNRLAASIQFWAQPKIIMDVPSRDFRPTPNVDSAVILLEQKTDPAPCNPRDYYAAMRIIFSQPRKTVLNNILDGIDAEKRVNRKKESITSALKNIGIPPECRPQNLSILNICAIAKAFFT